MFVGQIARDILARRTIRILNLAGIKAGLHKTLHDQNYGMDWINGSNRNKRNLYVKHLNNGGLEMRIDHIEYVSACAVHL